MAESDLVKDLHDTFLRCAICMEGYKSPRMLPCIHSFCLKCLIKLAQSIGKKSFSCPTCRAAVTIPKTGLKDLPSNFLLVSLMERLNLADTIGSTTSSKCNFCHGVKNLQCCIDCNMHVCVTCKHVHDKIPDCRDHKVIPIDKFNDEKYMKGILAVEVPRCSEHQKEKLRFYCTNCSKLVCRDCAIVSHRGHECLEPKARLNIAKQNLERAIENSGKAVISVEEMSANINAATTSIEKQITNSEQKVDKQYDRSIERLKADWNKLKVQLEEIRKKQCTPLKETKDEVTNWTEAMENTQVVAKKIMTAGNQWDILGIEKDITDAFTKLHDDEVALNNKRLRVQEVSNTTITFSLSVMSVSGSASEISTPVNGNLLGTVKLSPHKTIHVAKAATNYATTLTGNQPDNVYGTPMETSFGFSSSPPKPVNKTPSGGYVKSEYEIALDRHYQINCDEDIERLKRAEPFKFVPESSRTFSSSPPKPVNKTPRGGYVLSEYEIALHRHFQINCDEDIERLNREEVPERFRARPLNL